MSNYQVWNQVWYHPCYLLISTNSTNLYEIEKGSLWVRGVISKSSDCWMLPITLKFLLSHKKTFSDMHCLITRFRVSNSTKSVTVVPFLPLASLTHLHSRMIYINLWNHSQSSRNRYERFPVQAMHSLTEKKNAFLNALPTLIMFFVSSSRYNVLQKWNFIFNKLWSQMFDDNKKKHCEHDFERHCNITTYSIKL